MLANKRAEYDKFKLANDTYNIERNKYNSDLVAWENKQDIFN